MIDLPQAKSMAKALRKALGERGVDLTHGACLDLVARQFGRTDWNGLAATGGEERSVAPILFVEHGRETEAAVFYEKVLGARTIRKDAVDGRIVAVEFRIGSRLMAIAGSNPRREAEPGLGGPFFPKANGAVTGTILIDVEDCAATLDRARNHGGAIRDPAGRSVEGPLAGAFFDPFGHIWVVKEARPSRASIRAGKEPGRLGEHPSPPRQ